MHILWSRRTIDSAKEKERKRKIEMKESLEALSYNRDRGTNR
jgi:hypothetical protein